MKSVIEKTKTKRAGCDLTSEGPEMKTNTSSMTRKDRVIRKNKNNKGGVGHVVGGAGHEMEMNTCCATRNGHELI